MGKFGGSLIAGFLLVAVVPARAQEMCSLTQITNTTNATNLIAAINAAGTRVAFSSNADFLGSNGDGGFEIFLWDAFTGFTQITNINNPFALSPTINGAGTRITFASGTNPLGSNGDGNSEIFLWDASTGLTQITNTNSGNSSDPVINAAGNRITFYSNANPLGSNGDGNSEIFLWDATTGLTQITNTIGSGDSLLPSINASGTRI